MIYKHAHLKINLTHFCLGLAWEKQNSEVPWRPLIAYHYENVEISFALARLNLAWLLARETILLRKARGRRIYRGEFDSTGDVMSMSNEMHDSSCKYVSFQW